MGDFMQMFTFEEREQLLEALDEKQLALLRNAIVHEIRTNTQIHDILRNKFLPVHRRWTSQGRPRRASSPRSPRRPGPSS
jgi:hypothetical protein